MSTQFVSPGTVLGSAAEYDSGVGTYILNNYVYASVFGQLKVTETDQKKTFTLVTQKPTSTVPEVSDIVICRVSQINMRMATVEILSIEGHAENAGVFPGVIRSRDIRSFEIDKVEVYNSFRPGDIVRAQVISLGDARSYYLSTAKNELGVIYALGRGGVAMKAVDWETMECPITNTIEKRKVAQTMQTEE